ncbi:programmed cell death 1 ligand 1 isoform X2 [Eublepharis macularius]|uniref:Programmed cell death 1 ligand 1 isoform X2 n=1 Tax=Eublepharis macularius TaxID=481883 RepID=A0AA97JTC7_EUBMA|nr:programmed cell death 1 ligand 1 isoform X2 [Eublepharis macularius]
MPRKMFKLLPVVLLDIQLHLMTVDSQLNLKMLSILWKRISSKQEEKEVYKLHKGQEDLMQQDPDYRGRANLLHNELQMGCSALNLTNVKMTDAGSFLCVINYGEADYKYITLEVKAPYKRINVQKIRDPEEESLIFICQSEGYPLAEVSWHDRKNPNISMVANTTFELTNDGLFNITSILQVKQSISGNYTCVFWNKKLNENTSAHVSALQLDYVGESASVYEKKFLFLIIPICLLVSPFLAVVRKKSSTTLCSRRGNCRNVSHSSRANGADVSLEITSSPLI